MQTNWAKIAGDVYEAGLDRTLWPDALSSVAREVGADACILACRDTSRGHARLLSMSGVDDERMSVRSRDLASDDPWTRSEVALRTVPAAYVGHQITPERDSRTSGFFRDWMEPRGLKHAMVIVLHRRESLYHYLLLMRGAASEPFGDTDTRAAEDAAVTLSQIFERAWKVTRGMRERRAVWRAIDLMPLGCIVIDRVGRPITTNKAAQAIIANGDGIANVKGYLSVENHGRNVRLEDLIAEMQHNGRTAQDFTLRRSSGSRPLTCLLVPVNGEPHEEEGPTALLFIADPQRPPSFDAALIARLYGLSRAESRVAALLASGYRLEEVAGQLGIAYETVRKHLKQIFGKTGVFRQAELVRMLVSGPAGLVL